MDLNKSYIKRVIGLPGDRVRIDRGQVYVNDRPLMEDYVPEEIPRPILAGRAAGEAGSVFRFGDHRSSSSDSRSWGCVPRNEIYGKAVFVYWPLEKLGRLR